VAWVTERKDVLCGVFFMLTLWVYARYARHPRSPWYYRLALFFYALALMSKPVVVMLPFILLLLDYWPLRRFNASTFSRLFIEKIPFLLLALASCIPTILAERPGIATMRTFPFLLRIENALVSSVAYICQLFYPARLAILYPFPYRGLPVVEVIGALTFLVVVSLAVFRWRRKYPYLVTGWLWYLAMLVPVIGLVQVGEQARADRHTYLSQIGLDILLTWLVADLFCYLGRWRVVLAGLTSIVLAALVYDAHAQTANWKNSETIWEHTVSCTAANPTARINLGYAYEENGQLNEAIDQYRQLLKIEPYYTPAYHSIGNLLAQQGRLDEAIIQYQEALKLDEGLAASEDCNQIGKIHLQKDEISNAILQFKEALKFDPSNGDARNNLNQAVSSEMRLEKAVQQPNSTTQK
jgi:protein O-mannosyl-transferase